MLKRCLVLFTSLIITNLCFAQDTTEIKRILSGDVTEVFKVLKKDIHTRQGLFKALYKKKIPIAIGEYKDDKKIGFWRFSDPNGVTLQTYDYTNNRLLYEAPEDTTSNLRYFVDKELVPGDKVTKPVKAGGRYYGYLPYLTLFTLPADYRDIDKDMVTAVVELLISPGGRLADYKVSLTYRPFIDPFRVINMNVKLPDVADTIFKPATLNDEPIASRIMIRCVVNNRGHLDFE